MLQETFLNQPEVFLSRTMKKLRPSAILFDMDGVLIDSLDSWWHALNDALKRFKHQEITRDEFILFEYPAACCGWDGATGDIIQTYWGHDLKDNLRRLNLHPDVARFCNITYGGHMDSIHIYPDTKETLQELAAYKKAIITNTPTDCARQILKKFDIAQYFEAIITSDDVTKAKPDPEIVFMACERLGVHPETVVLIGDTKSDVQAGRVAGCTVIGLKIDADFSIQRLAELTNIIQ